MDRIVLFSFIQVLQLYDCKPHDINYFGYVNQVKVKQRKKKKKLIP